MPFPIQNTNNQKMQNAPVKGAASEARPNDAKTQALFEKKAQAESKVDSLEITATNNEGTLAVSTDKADEYQAQAQSYASEAKTAGYKVDMAQTLVAFAQVDCENAAAKVQQLDAKIEEQTKGFGGFLNSIGNVFTGAIDNLKQQREVAAGQQEKAEGTVEKAEANKTKYEEEVKTAEDKKTDAERNLEKQKQISESIEKKIAEAKASIGDKELEIEDYENAIREAMKEQNCNPTDGTIKAGAAALQAADIAAKEQGKKTTDQNTIGTDNRGGATPDVGGISAIVGDEQNGSNAGTGEGGEQNPAASKENLGVDENGQPIPPPAAEGAEKAPEVVEVPGKEENLSEKPKNGSVLDGLTNDLIESDKTKKDETENIEEALQKDPTTNMSDAQAEQTVAVQATQAKYEEAGIKIDTETIIKAIADNNVTELDAAVEAATVQNAIKSTGRVMLGRGFGITTRKESKENGEATAEFLDARADLNKTYNEGKNNSKDVRVEGFLNITETIQSNIVNGDTYSTSDLRGYTVAAASILADYDTSRQVTPDTQGVSMKYEQEKLKTQTLLDEEKEKFAGDDEKSGKVNDINIEFITVDYRYRNSRSTIEQMLLTKDMNDTFQEAQKLEQERIQGNSEAQAA